MSLSVKLSGESNSKGEQLIYIIYTYKSKKAKFSTKETVDPKYFDKSGTVRKGFEGYTRINAKIDQVKGEVNDILKKFILEDLEPIHNAVKTRHETQAPVNFDFFQLYRDWIEDMKAQQSEGTIKHHQTSYNNLMRFKEANPKIGWRLPDINLNFYNKYLSFILSQYKGKPAKEHQGVQNSTADIAIKELLTFLHYLEGANYTLSPQVRKFKRLRGPSEILFLTKDELEAFRVAPLTGRHDRVRDLFVLQANTGLRISDFSRLSKDHIQVFERGDYKGYKIVMRAFKNLRAVNVLLSKVAYDLLEKYDFELPLISEQKYNKYIKEALNEAGIHRMVERIERRGGEKTVVMKEICWLLSNHDAIKTFITHALNEGVKVKTVAAITGKSIKTIQKHYEGITEEQTDLEMMRAFVPEAFMKIA